MSETSPGITPSTTPSITSNITRIDALTCPPTVGTFYLVPCIDGHGLRPKMDWIPVLGHWHTDKELSFDVPHYHMDWRFMPLAAARAIAAEDHGYLSIMPYSEQPDRDAYVLRLAQGRVIHLIDGESACKREVVWKKRKCLRKSEFPAHFDDKKRRHNPFAMACETLCRGRRLDLQTMQCPHKGLSLAQSPVVDGCITCPGHGLRFDATTGELVSRFSIEEWAAYGPDGKGGKKGQYA